MPKRVKKPSRPKDVNQLAHRLVQLSTSEADESSNELTPPEVSAYMARIGRKGGKTGGKRRLETMSQDQRSDIASKAARARWAKRKAGEKKR